jgi:PAS domain S-box-containing protein
MVSIILIVSLALQFVAVFFALRLIKVTGKSLAWGLIAVAIALMALRRSISLIDTVVSGHATRPDMYVELVALAISVLMAAGIWRITPIFKELKSKADRLRESEERYRNLFESAPDAIFIADLESGKIADANSKAALLIGRSRDEIIGMHQSGLHPAAMAEYSRESFKKHAIEAHSRIVSEPFEHIVLRADGTEVPVEIMVQMVVMNGKPLMQGIFRDITERKKTEQALRDSEKRFRSLVETSNDWIWEVDENAAYTYASPRIQTILGYEPAEVLGKTPFDLMSPEEAKRVAALFGPFVAAHQPLINIENTNLHKDGHPVILETSGALIMGADGKFCGYRGIDRDISARKEMENRLKLSSSYTRSLIEASLDPLVTISPEGKITDVNHATEKITGMGRSELIGADFADYFTEPDKARAGYRQVFAQGYVTDYPLALRHSDGHITDVLYNASVYRNEAGVVLGVFAAARDITERKRAEAMRTQLAAIVESSNDAIVGKTPRGIIASWNKGAERIYGYTADEIIGKHITALASPSRHAEIHEFLEKIRNGGAVANYESERIRKDGVPIRVALTLSPIKDAAGNIIGISTIARDITEKKRMEEELRRASIYNRSLIEASLDPLVTISPEGKITDVNNATEKATGKSRQEMVGTDFSDYFTDPDKAREGYQQVFAKGFVTDYPLALRHRDGHVTDVLYNASVYRNEAGEVRGVFAAARDVTERNKAEAARRESEALFQAALKILPVGLWVADTIGKLIFGNDKGRQIWAGEKYVGIEQYGEYKGWWPGTGEPLGAHDWGMARALEKGEISIEEEIEIECFDGTHKIIFNSALPLRRSDGSISGAIGINQDITRRKQAEDALKKSEERLRLEVARMPIAYIVWDKDFRVTSWNPAAENIFGFTFEEAKGRHPYDMIVPPEAQPQVDAIWSRLLAGDASAHSVNENQTKDGHTIFCEWTNTPLTHPDGTVLGVMSMVQNITERKQAEDEVRRLNAELEQRVAARTAQLEDANKELESFSYSVSHDLRTPLRAIDGFSHILLEGYAGKLDDEGKRLLNVVRDNTCRMEQLIDDMLRFSRTSRLEMTFSEIDMEGLAQAVVEELRPSVAGRKFQVEIGAIPRTTGDRAMLRQVFVNLLSNAIKFTRSREDATIWVGGSIEGDETVYYVRDNGAGFDMQYADKLFGVFQRLHTMKEFEGTGIGLAIVKRIVTRHGGRVWAEGKVNGGATIYFALPLKGNEHE